MNIGKSNRFRICVTSQGLIDLSKQVLIFSWKFLPSSGKYQMQVRFLVMLYVIWSNHYSFHQIISSAPFILEAKNPVTSCDKLTQVSSASKYRNKHWM